MKKILLFTIALSLWGCSQDQPLVKNDIPTEVTLTENLYEYDVPNVSQAFSNKDLIYFILVDRFSDGDVSNNDFPDFSEDKTQLKSYLGGDLQGIIDQLDYIQSLGTTTIWLSPVVKNEPYGYHGYWTEDFGAVDPHFGDMAILKELVNKAHDKGIKVILDYVVNHTGYNHPWLKDPEKKDWFHQNGDIQNFNDQTQVENNNLAGLPDLNTENPEVKAYFFENALWWIRETNIDGMRLDTVRHVPKEFWNEFAYVIKQDYPDFYFLGEVWMNSASTLETYHQLGLDGLTNYSMYNGIEKTFKLYGDANTLKIAIQNEKKFSSPELNGIFLDNHDVSRLISRSSKNGDIFLKQALTFVMTYPSIPIIYYGTEVGLDGKADPDNRKMMDWSMDLNDSDIYDYYMKMLELRNLTKEYNQVKILSADKNHIAIEYSSLDKKMITVFNVSEQPQSIVLNSPGTYYDFITHDPVVLTSETTWSCEALSTLILLEDQ